MLRLSEKHVAGQLIARHVRSKVRFYSVGASLGSGIRMSWTANGVELPFFDPRSCSTISSSTSAARRPPGAIAGTRRQHPRHRGRPVQGYPENRRCNDRERLDQFQTSVRELETTPPTAKAGWAATSRPSTSPKNWAGSTPPSRTGTTPSSTCLATPSRPISRAPAWSFRRARYAGRRRHPQLPRVHAQRQTRGCHC